MPLYPTIPELQETEEASEYVNGRIVSIHSVEGHGIEDS